MRTTLFKGREVNKKGSAAEVKDNGHGIGSVMAPEAEAAGVGRTGARRRRQQALRMPTVTYPATCPRLFRWQTHKVHHAAGVPAGARNLGARAANAAVGTRAARVSRQTRRREEAAMPVRGRRAKKSPVIRLRQRRQADPPVEASPREGKCVALQKWWRCQPTSGKQRRTILASNAMLCLPQMRRSDVALACFPCVPLARCGLARVDSR